MFVAVIEMYVVGLSFIGVVLMFSTPNMLMLCAKSVLF